MYRITEVVGRVTIEGQTYPTYGIRIQSDEGCAVAEDISTDRQAVRALRRRMRKGHLSPLHLPDAVDDWLSENR